MSGNYLEYRIMKEMGWSYRELRECPLEVVQDIIRFMNTEAKFNKSEAKKWQSRK